MLRIAVYYRPRVEATVEVIQVERGGLCHHVLIENEPLDVEAGERDPWVILAGLYRALAAARAARAVTSGG